MTASRLLYALAALLALLAAAGLLAAWRGGEGRLEPFEEPYGDEGLFV